MGSHPAIAKPETHPPKVRLKAWFRHQLERRLRDAVPYGGNRQRPLLQAPAS